jgi:hypothetical protein
MTRCAYCGTETEAVIECDLCKVQNRLKHSRERVSHWSNMLRGATDDQDRQTCATKIRFYQKLITETK